MGKALRTAVATMVVVVLWGSAPAARAQDLLNPSFEDPETEAPNPWNDLAAHWGRWGNWMNRESAWLPTRTGSSMLGYHHWEIKEDNSSGAYQDIINTTPNANYTFSVYAYKDTGTNLEYVELRIEKLDGKDVIASKVYWNPELKTAEWQLLTVTGMNTEPGLRVVIVIKPKQGGSRQGCIKFDDASLQIEG